MSDAKKFLYIVTFTNELVVLAETPDDAHRIAERHRCEGIESDGPALPMDHFPSDWDGESEPHGGDSRSLDELIAAGCAPVLTALRDRLRGPTT